MIRRDVVYAVILAAISAGHARIGPLLVRVIGSTGASADLNRPRLAASEEYLRSGRVPEVSMHTRICCAFEAIYLCCCEMAASQGTPLEGLEHPSMNVIEIGLSAMGAPEAERLAVKKLAQWRINMSPLLPHLSVFDACNLAVHTRSRATAMLARSRN